MGAGAEVLDPLWEPLGRVNRKLWQRGSQSGASRWRKKGAQKNLSYPLTLGPTLHKPPKAEHGKLFFYGRERKVSKFNLLPLDSNGDRWHISRRINVLI